MPGNSDGVYLQVTMMKTAVHLTGLLSLIGNVVTEWVY